ncbi:LOW QUALITY PROTEIN: AT-rich interactive domain-containing protein 3B [Dromiciops gliroides]|uniref:LOW QUALITY PROTEIN: AT-rich interactive domain-containing protein 3B n=1 Tax=Dromiciops gliroides TaxID=33562 RepID=UPI001CC800D0|nr:LOW QUALITY PROTEIN: AT-rich interactive domain-containing protein 3B [Dromiciops gliroides]
MRLEALMEQLQKQQHPAPVQMDSRERQERQMREAQLLYAQQLAAQQASLTSPSTKASSSSALGQMARIPPATAASRVLNSEADEEEEGLLEDEEGNGEEAEIPEKEAQRSSKYFHMQKVTRHDPRATPMSNPPPLPAPGLQRGLHIKEDHAKDAPKASPSVSASGHPTWNLEEQLKQNGGLTWDDADGGRGREISRDFAKLYELDSDPERKEFLDDLFIFMQKRGTPINRIPIMAKQILDLYMLYKLVTEKGGLVEIINKKIWREITKGLKLPTSITSAAFTLRTQYMKYLYAYECEKKALSSPAELQAAIDGNRREGRRPSYSSSLFSYSPTTPAGPASLLSPPKIRFPILGLAPGSGGTGSPRLPPAATLRKGDGVAMTVPMPSRLAVPVTLAGSQQPGTRTATLEQLRERLEAGEPPEKKPSRMTEEEQRFMQQAFRRNLLSVARQLPMKVKINGRAEDRSEAAAALNLSMSGIGSINMSVEINGTIYAGVLFAQKPVVHLIASPAPQSTCSSSSSSVSSHCSPSPTSSRGTPSAEPSTSWAL